MRTLRLRPSFARLPRAARALAVLAASAFVVTVAAAQDAPPPGGTPPAPPGGATPPQGAAREAMWPAATAEGWKKPVLITFQRTWEDALAVSKETGKPILVCVNMDGEIASEHYAGVRYRDPDVAPLYEPYVCVIASVYRHNPRDYDDEGSRVLCPRFGSVTCGEHIAIEPILYEKFFDGKRIAPRHVMVDLDGKEKYDVYYRNDVQSVLDDVKNGPAGLPAPKPVVRGDRPMSERVASRDIQDRKAVEGAYLQGDAAQRRAMLEAALEQGGATPLDLLRLAVFGLDADLARLARKALAQTEDPAATDLIAEALRVPMEPAEREALIAALARLGKSAPMAQWLSVVHQGLSARSGTIDVNGWTAAGSSYEPPPSASEWADLEMQLESKAAAAKAKPDDAGARLDLAETALALAIKAPVYLADDPRMARAFGRQLFEDARRSAIEAEKLGATAWRTDAVRMLVAFKTGDTAEAYARAETAMKSMPVGEPSWNGMSVLTIYAESRWKAIKAAMLEKKPWPPQWLTDVNAAYSVLRKHPHGTDAQVVWHYDFVTWLRVRDQAGRILDEGIARFPESRPLHERLRTRMLQWKGPDGLEAAYDAILAAKDAPSIVERYAAQASFVAAEFHRRGANAEKATAAYGRAIAHYEKAALADADMQSTADRQVALALAGCARIAYEADDDDRALRDILASFDRCPAVAATLDGLNFTPVSTAQVLRQRMRERNKEDLLQKLEAALKALDPALLVLPKNM